MPAVDEEVKGPSNVPINYERPPKRIFNQERFLPQVLHFIQADHIEKCGPNQKAIEAEKSRRAMLWTDHRYLIDAFGSRGVNLLSKPGIEMINVTSAGETDRYRPYVVRGLDALEYMGQLLELREKDENGRPINFTLPHDEGFAENFFNQVQDWARTGLGNRLLIIDRPMYLFEEFQLKQMNYLQLRSIIQDQESILNPLWSRAQFDDPHLQKLWADSVNSEKRQVVEPADLEGVNEESLRKIILQRQDKLDPSLKEALVQFQNAEFEQIVNELIDEVEPVIEGCRIAFQNQPKVHRSPDNMPSLASSFKDPIKVVLETNAPDVGR